MTYEELKNVYPNDYKDIESLICSCLYWGEGMNDLKETNLIKSLKKQ